MILWVSQLSEPEKWALGLLAMLVAGIAAQWFSQRLGHSLAVRRDHRAVFCAASIKFRAVVLSELSGLYPIPSNWPSDRIAIDIILRKKFPALQSAVAEFRFHLCCFQKGRFDKAWRIYRMGKNGREIDQEDYWQYIPHSGSGYHNGKLLVHDNVLSYQSTFKENIDQLLKFARET